MTEDILFTITIIITLFGGGYILGWFVGYFSGYLDKVRFNKPYWDWHLEKDKRWKRHVAEEYKNWKKLVK